MPRGVRGTRQAAGRRDQVLEVLRQAPGPLTISEIADRLAVHPNTVRFHLETLIEHGQVEKVASVRGSQGRPPQLFRSVRGMDPAGPREYRMLAEVLADSLADDPQGHRRAIQAGRSWGRRHSTAVAVGGGSVDRLLALLDEYGFAPERTAPPTPPGRAPGSPPGEIRLRNCPFLELAVDRPQVICTVHLGLMQGALEGWGSSVSVERLDAVAEPDACVARLES